jgi:hypothetical protein
MPATTHPSPSRATSSTRSPGKEEKRKELNAEVEIVKKAEEAIGKNAEEEIVMNAEAETEGIVEAVNAENTTAMRERIDLPEEITEMREAAKEEEAEIETND